MFTNKKLLVLICLFYFTPCNAFAEGVNNTPAPHSFQSANKSILIMEKVLDAIPEKIKDKKEIAIARYWLSETAAILQILEKDIYNYNEIEKKIFNERIINLIYDISNTTGLPCDKIMEKVESLMTTGGYSCWNSAVMTFLSLGIATLFALLSPMIPVFQFLTIIPTLFFVYYAISLCNCGYC